MCPGAGSEWLMVATRRGLNATATARQPAVATSNVESGQPVWRWSSDVCLRGAWSQLSVARHWAAGRWPLCAGSKIGASWWGDLAGLVYLSAPAERSTPTTTSRRHPPSARHGCASECGFATREMIRLTTRRVSLVRARMTTSVERRCQTQEAIGLDQPFSRSGAPGAPDANGQTHRAGRVLSARKAIR